MANISFVLPKSSFLTPSYSVLTIFLPTDSADEAFFHDRSQDITHVQRRGQCFAYIFKEIMLLFKALEFSLKVFVICKEYFFAQGLVNEKSDFCTGG